MNIWISFSLAYLAVGVLLAFVGPLARKRSQEKFVIAVTGAHQARWKRVLFDLVLCTGIVVLWVVFLVSEIHSRGGVHVSRQPTPTRAVEHDVDEPRGLTFQSMGGVGQLDCGDCGFSQQILSFTHAFDGSHTSGYQCQSCGNLLEIEYEPAFPHGTPEAEVLFKLSMVNLIERQMKDTPRSEWLRTWEPNLARYRRELKGVDVERLLRRQAEVGTAFEAKLICPCGGRLSRDEVVTCPSCRGRNLSYQLRYIT
jgi:hypothetical protein